MNDEEAAAAPAVASTLPSASHTSRTRRDQEIETAGYTSTCTPDESACNLHSIPLVELCLENITYAPVTRSAGGRGGRPSCCTSRRGGMTEIKSRKVILQDVSTRITPYTLSAILGPSGGGKSSLVSVAAGYYSPTDLIGASKIHANGGRGAPPKRLVSVVHQDDLLLPNLTVKETITFAARLKNDESVVCKDEVMRLVDETINELGLSAVKDSLVGGVATRGISGGERKRLAVAVELVGRPSVILLDEPTSGLDSTSAYSLVLKLKELARVGHSISVVVHQPRTAIFDLFDDLLLLSRGRVVYSGRPDRVREYLESIPSVEALPAQTNVADWIMDCIVADERREGGGILANCWTNTQGNRDKKEMLEKRERISRRLSSLADLHSEPKFKTSTWTQLRLLTRRSMVQQRGERLTQVACIFTTAYILFTGILYWRLPDNTNRVYERLSLLFFVIITQANAIVVSSMTLFSRERNLLRRERAKKMYGVLPYFIAKTISDMTTTIILPSLYGIIVYWMANLRPTAAAFFQFVLIFYLTVSTSQSVGLLLSVAIPNLQVTLMLAPALMIFLLILSGFYVPLDNLNPAIAWASWLSFGRYGYSALVINEFSGRSIDCAEGEVSVSLSGGSDECPLPGDDVLASIGLSGAFTNLWLNVGILVLIQIFIRGLTYVLLRRTP